MNTNEARVYPQCCTSAYCGRIDCTGCANQPVLDAFRAWVKAYNARCADPIWSPSVYVAEPGKSDEKT